MTAALSLANRAAPGRAKRKRPRTVILLGYTVIAAAVLSAALAPILAPFDPLQVRLSDVNAAPGVNGHLLGADASGRDILSRLIYGARTSLIGPLIAIVVSTVAGVVLGAIAAWRGGWLDSVLSRINDFLFAFPGLLAAVFAVALFGKGFLAPALGVAIAYTPIVARLTRTVVLEERHKLYVRADLVLGYSGARVLTRTVLPNVLPIVLSQAFIGFGYALIDLAALSFLGLGVQAPEPDWGVMLNESTSSMLQGAWWVMAAPAVVIVLVVVAFNVVGESLLDNRNGDDQ